MKMMTLIGCYDNDTSFIFIRSFSCVVYNLGESWVKEAWNRNTKPLNFVILANWFHSLAVGQFWFHLARIISNIPNQMRNYVPRMECNLRYELDFLVLWDVGAVNSNICCCTLFFWSKIKMAKTERREAPNMERMRQYEFLCVHQSISFKTFRAFSNLLRNVEWFCQEFIQIFWWIKLRFVKTIMLLFVNRSRNHPHSSGYFIFFRSESIFYCSVLKS